jgi:ABC-2 type transport system ATP-binding protein
MARADSPVVRLVELTKRYGNLTALNRFTLDIAEGEIVGLLGPHRAGNTHPLRNQQGVLQPSPGRPEI